MSIENIIALLGIIGMGGIILFFLNKNYEQQKQKNEHDIKIFNKSNEILNEEKLSFIVGDVLWGNHSISDKDFYVLTHWCEYFQKTGNRYLDMRIEKENQKLLKNLLDLTRYVGRNFFSIHGQNPNNNAQYLQPDLNLDRAINIPNQEMMRRYDGYVKELHSLIDKTLDQYTKYRLAVKQRLKI